MSSNFRAISTVMTKFSNWAPIVFLTLLSLAAFFINHEFGEFWFPDEPRHAMDGVFFYDFIVDFPISNIVGYLEEYFARFPALGFTWYLPFFALTEASFFFVFGVSIVAANCTCWPGLLR